MAKRNSPIWAVLDWVGGPIAHTLLQRRLFTSTMAISMLLSIGADVANRVMGVSAEMVHFGWAITLSAGLLWALARWTRQSTQSLALLAILVAGAIVSVAWLRFDGAAGIAPSLLLWGLALPMFLEKRWQQVVAVGAMLVLTAGLSAIDVLFSDWIRSSYLSPELRLMDAAVTRVLVLGCCATLMLWIVWQHKDAVQRAEEERALREQVERARLSAESRFQAEQVVRLRRMARGLAHDINNVLTVLHCAVEGMEDECAAPSAVSLGTDEGFVHHLHAMKVGVQTAETMTRRLAADPLASEEASSTDLRDLVVVQAELLRGLVPHINIRMALPTGALRVDMERGLLEQVVLNLGLNAAQAMEGQGTLMFRLWATSNDAVLEVEDTGCGIPADLLERIFEPLFTTRESGNGIGLTLVRGNIERAGGRIQVRSRVGLGTCFTVLLPRSWAECGEEDTVRGRVGGTLGQELRL